MEEKHYILESPCDTLWKINLPANIMKLAGIKNGDEVEVEVRGGGEIIIKKK